MKVIGIAILLLAAPFAEAHTGLAQHGFMSGLSHPLLGIDHLMAMLAIGIWAGRMGGKASWSMPLVFTSLLVVSAAGLQGLGSMPLVENGIAVSLLLLGLFVVFAIKLPTAIGMLVVGLFAVFHGIAHGVELSLATSPFWYVAGFVLTTALLQTIGLTAARGRFEKFNPLIRLTGILIAILGGWMLLTN